MKHLLGRRQFLKLALCSPLGAAAALPFHSNHQRTYPVIILGAGLAGLAAAYELVKSGCSVLVIEAQQRSGGRVLTLRNRFSDGLTAEAGAMFATDAQEHVLRCARALDVPLVEYDSSRSSGYIAFLGKGRYRIAPGTALPDAIGLPDGEKGMSMNSLWSKYVTSAILALQYESRADRALVEKYDGFTMADFLRSQGASETAISLLRLGYLDSFGDGIDRAGAVQFLRTELLNLSGNRTYVIQGGSDVLPSAFVTRLSGFLRYGARAKVIRQLNEGIQVVVEDDRGEKETISGTHVISTLPLPAMREIQFDPPLSKKKQQASAEIPYASVTRVYLQCSERFWAEEGVVGDADTDLPIMRVIEQPLSDRGKRGILESFTSGERSRELQAMEDSARVQTVLDHMERVHPGTKTHFERALSWSWPSDSHASGAFAWYRPNQLSVFFDDLSRPEGRIHFAGEHTSLWAARMEGALESGIRAAREVLAKIRS